MRIGMEQCELRSTRMKQGLLWEEWLPPGELTPEKPDGPQLQKCVQSPVDTDVSFSTPTR